MRSIATGPVLTVRAVAGLHVVILAWDFAGPQDAKRVGLMGFAIERTDLDKEGAPARLRWLEGGKRFKSRDQDLPPGTPLPTSEHPLQTFQWGDYTAWPGAGYRYRVVPAYGSPGLLTLDDASATTVEVTTEREEGDIAGGGRARHDVYFNRGVAGSQAYARKFGKVKPDPADPGSKQMRWLSRGLFEALLGFIRRAAGDDAADHGLRAAFYEFRYRPVGDALGDAAAKGADVKVLYEAQTYKAHNQAMVASAGIGGFCAPQKARAGVRHNKFIVLIRKGTPVAVWTGSTNISTGGIFGHSNVGHVLWDDAVARHYLEYWEALASPSVTTGRLKDRNARAEPTPDADGPPPDGRVLTLFSPRDPGGPSPTLAWYAWLLGSARRIACMTFAFNVDPVFSEVVGGRTEALNYLLLDKAPGDALETEMRRNENTTIAVGAKLGAGDLEGFLGESLTGFNSNRYIHDKFMLVDPLGDDPVVVTGSANFSGASQSANDENMLAFCGDLRVADIYFGEFMRLFDHLYSRYLVEKLNTGGHPDPSAGYLKEDTGEWLPQHFEEGPKSRRRRYFVGEG